MNKRSVDGLTTVAADQFSLKKTKFETTGEGTLTFPSGNKTVATVDQLDDGGIITNAVEITNTTESTNTVTGALVVDGGVGIAKRLHIGGITEIKNDTQSTNSTNGSLIVRGGVGIVKNVHLGGTIHVPSGNNVTPSYGFIGSPNTGVGRESIGGDLCLYHNGTVRVGLNNVLVYSLLPHQFIGLSASPSAPAITFAQSPTTGLYTPQLDQLAIVTGGLTRISFNAGGIVNNGNMFIPNGSVTAPAIRFSNSTSTGIYSTGTDNFSISTAGAQRFSINNAGFTQVLTSQFSVPSGSAAGPSYMFGGDGNTGFYRIAEDNIGISTNGTLRMNIATTAIVCSLPLQLQTTGGTASNLDFYQEYTHNVGWNFGSTNSNVQVGNVKYVRIGKIVTMTITYDWTAALTMNDVGGGTAIMNTATLIVMRPTQTVSFLGFAQVNGANTTVRVLQNTDGTTQITPLAGGNFAQTNTLRLWTNSFTYAL